MTTQRKKIAVIVGTRPEAIKMVPVFKALKQREDQFDVLLLSTAQHRQMLDQVFSIFNVKPDIDLDIMRPNQSLSELTSRVLLMMDQTLKELNPDLLLVQGDTTTVLASALSAFFNKIPVGHVEAGLRSWDILNPFPEEMNRSLTSPLAQIHFAPTRLAQENLLKVGVPLEKIVVTGNTVVDALQFQLNLPFNFNNTLLKDIPFEGKRILLLTSHRRESWGEDLQNICLAIKVLAKQFKDLIVIYPVHMNPKVRETVMDLLSQQERIFLTEPLDYLTFINLMKKSFIILTDSGGVQEEAPSLKKPLLVLRKLTERPEAMMAGLAKVVGSTPEEIVKEASLLLNSESAYRLMTEGPNPFGDGKASERIVTALLRWAKNQQPLLSPQEEFLLS